MSITLCQLIKCKSIILGKLKVYHIVLTNQIQVLYYVDQSEESIILCWPIRREYYQWVRGWVGAVLSQTVELVPIKATSNQKAIPCTVPGDTKCYLFVVKNCLMNLFEACETPEESQSCADLSREQFESQSRVWWSWQCRCWRRRCRRWVVWSILSRLHFAELRDWLRESILGTKSWPAEIELVINKTNRSRHR